MARREEATAHGATKIACSYNSWMKAWLRERGLNQVSILKKGTLNEANIDPRLDPNTSEKRSPNAPKSLPNRLQIEPNSA